MILEISLAVVHHKLGVAVFLNGIVRTVQAFKLHWKRSFHSLYFFYLENCECIQFCTSFKFTTGLDLSTKQQGFALCRLMCWMLK